MVPGAGRGVYTGGGAGDAVKKNRLRAVRERAVTGRTESSAPTGALPHPLCRAGPMCPAAQGNVDPPCLPLRGRWQREVLAEGEIPHGFLSPSRLRRQPPPRGGLAARHRRADGTSRTPSPTDFNAGHRTPRAFVPLRSTAGSSLTPVYRRRSPQETGRAARRRYGVPRGGSPPRCSRGWSWRRCRCARRWSGRGSACRRARSSCSG